MKAYSASSFGLVLMFLFSQHLVFAQEFSGISGPEQSAIVLAVTAEGAQIYESKPKADGGLQWSLKAPEAELKSAAGQVIGKHGAGPSWTFNDGSSIVGSLPPLKNVPVSGTIPWLLLAVKSKIGSGLLDQVDYVMRIATAGGAAPAEPPKAEGETTKVNYHAIYLFLKKEAANK
jgi:Protein of unknown function (DUF3455)